MKRLFVLVFSLLFAFSSTAFAGKIVTDSLSSAVLGASVKYNVYLPDSFAKSEKQYPVIYLLHGLSGGYTDWVSMGNMKTVVDELIGTGECREVVIVMPNAGGADTHNVWNGYFNMPGWNYQDFFFGEFIPAVESKYRVIADKGHRAIMGLSMGGGGCTVYSQRHPEMFSSCYAMSAWLDNDSMVGKTDKIDKLYYVCQSVHENSAIDYLANADDAIKEQLRTVKWFIDCGDDDFLLDLSVKFHQMMRDSGIKSELRVRNGVHNWEYWHLALRMSLPFASRNFDK